MNESTDHIVIPAEHRKADTFAPPLGGKPTQTNSKSPSSRSTSIRKVENVVQVRIVPKTPHPSGEELGTE